MAKIDVTALDSELRSGKISPVYVLAGQDHYLRLTAKNRIKEEADGDCFDFDGDKVKAGGVVDSLRNTSLLAKRRVVVVNEAHKIKDKERDLLEKYIAKPLSDAVLILDMEKLDERLRFSKMLKDSACIVDCKPLYPSKIPSWINIEAKRRGKRISQDAAEFLAQISGPDLGIIIQSLEKLSLYVGNKQLVELADIEEAVADTAQQDIFALTKAVGERKAPLAMAMLADLMNNSQPPQVIIAMLARHFRILAKAIELPQRTSDRDAASALSVHPFYVREYLDQARKITCEDLEKAFAILSRADRESKSSRVPPLRILERAIVDICIKKK